MQIEVNVYLIVVEVLLTFPESLNSLIESIKNNFFFVKQVNQQFAKSVIKISH